MNSPNIMIVEDNTTVAEDCRLCLESFGYGVTSVVTSGEESIVKAEMERPDGVLMDIHLRDKMDGIEAARQIHSRFDIPVVFLSAYSDKKLLERSKQVGSYGYLIKPFEERELHTTLEIALSRAKADREHMLVEALLLQTQKMEAIGSLAGGIAHQFNNALSVITANMDLLEMCFSCDKSVAEYVKTTKVSALKMSRLTDQLLAYSRSGKYFVETISLTDFVIETLLQVRYSIEPDVRVETDLPRGILNVEVDLAQMQMVFSAALTNASEAIQGKGHIRIACKKVALTDENIKEFPGLKPRDYACLTVVDDGKGMDEQTKSQLFDPFFTTKAEGRGLGMAAAYGIVRNHDGLVLVDSELGQGTTIDVYLPLVGTPVKES